MNEDSRTGTAVLVDGKVIAWFCSFDQEAVEWCSYNYFGKWITRKSKEPEIIPWTTEELIRAENKAKEFIDLFHGNE